MEILISVFGAVIIVSRYYAHKEEKVKALNPNFSTVIEFKWLDAKEIIQFPP